MLIHNSINQVGVTLTVTNSDAISTVRGAFFAFLTLENIENHIQVSILDSYLENSILFGVLQRFVPQMHVYYFLFNQFPLVYPCNH